MMMKKYNVLVKDKINHPITGKRVEMINTMFEDINGNIVDVDKSPSIQQYSKSQKASGIRLNLLKCELAVYKNWYPLTLFRDYYREDIRFPNCNVKSPDQISINILAYDEHSK